MVGLFVLGHSSRPPRQPTPKNAPYVEFVHRLVMQVNPLCAIGRRTRRLPSEALDSTKGNDYRLQSILTVHQDLSLSCYSWISCSVPRCCLLCAPFLCLFDRSCCLLCIS